LGAAAGIGVVSLLAMSSVQGFREKFQTATLISEASALAEQGVVRDFIITENVSALAVAINLEIARKNFSERPLLGAGIGAHSSTYDVKAPDYAFLSPIVYGLNREDAASLSIRLISETGVLGTALFLLGILVILRHGWSAIRAYARSRSRHDELTPLGAIGAGLTASCAALCALYLMRMGAYFPANLWGSMAFVVGFAMLTARITLPSVPRTFAVPHPRPVEHPAE
jgi:hypothetical protein